MLIESNDFFSFSDDDGKVSKPCFVSLLFFPEILYLFRFVFFHQQIFFFHHFHELNQHTISERWKIGFDLKNKNKRNQNKTLRVSSHFMDEDSYVQFEKLKSKNETVKLTFYFFSCVVLPFCSLAINRKVLRDFFLVG